MSLARTRTFSRKAAYATVFVTNTPVEDHGPKDELDNILSSDSEDEKKNKKGDVKNKENTQTTHNKVVITNYDNLPSRRGTPTKTGTPRKRVLGGEKEGDKGKKPRKDEDEDDESYAPRRLSRTQSASETSIDSERSKLMRTNTTVDAEGYVLTRKMIDELEYILDGIESQPDLLRESMYQLAKLCRSGGRVLSLALHSQGFIMRLAEALTTTWKETHHFKKDTPTVLGAAIALHSLAIDPANVPAITRCIPLLHDIISMESIILLEEGDAEHARMKKILDVIRHSNDYMQSYADVQALGLRTLAALTFTRQPIGDQMRAQGVLDSVVEALSAIVSKLDAKEEPSVFVLGDIKYALVFLENLTATNIENRQHIMEEEDNQFVPSMMKIIEVARGCLESPTAKKRDAAVDCLNGVLKMLLNITYENDDSCLKVAAGSGDVKDTKGLRTITSLLAISSTGADKFDMQQHAVGLLVNLVERNKINRVKFGSIDGAIAKIVELYLEGGVVDTSADDNEDTISSGGKVDEKVRAAYTAMLLGCLLRENKENLKTIRELLAANKIASLTPLVHMLNQFVTFQANAGILSQEIYKSIQDIVQYIKTVETDNTAATGKTMRKRK